MEKVDGSLYPTKCAWNQRFFVSVTKRGILFLAKKICTKSLFSLKDLLNLRDPRLRPFHTLVTSIKIIESICISLKISAKKIAENTQFQIILAISNIVCQRNKIQTNKKENIALNGSLAGSLIHFLFPTFFHDKLC